MKKVKFNFYVDLSLVLCLFIVGISGLILKFAFVSGEPGVGRRIVFMGLSKADVLPWHEFFGLVMVFLMFLHVVLHFDWLVCMVKDLFSKG